MLVPALIALSLIFAVVALRLRIGLGGARSRLEALKTVGGREREQLLSELCEIRSVVADAERKLAETREKLEVLDPAPSLVGRTLVVTDREEGLTLRGILHAQHADRWTFRDGIYISSSGEQPAGGLVHLLVGNIGPVQEITDALPLGATVTPLRAAEVAE